MKGSKSAFVLPFALAAITVMAVLTGSVSGQADGAVRIGEPLHIYLRKDVPQQMLYLHFYPPSGNVPLSDTSSRFTIDRKGGPNATVVVFFPRDINSNFLQFEPNASVQAEYQLMLFARAPMNLSKGQAKLLMTIELDYQRDNIYDRKFTTTIAFDANSSFVKVSGPLPMDAYEMKRFDGKRGGKMRLTLSRVDDLDTIVVIHCGSSEHPSFIQLPFSKYRYVPGNDQSKGISPVIVLGIAAAFVIAFVVVLKVLYRDKGKKPPAEDERTKRRRGKRWSRKGKKR